MIAPRHRLLVPSLAGCLLTLSLPAENAIQHYVKARRMERAQQPEKAYPLFDQAARAAATEGLAEYAFCAHYHAAYLAYQLSRYSDCIRHAEAGVELYRANRPAEGGSPTEARLELSHPERARHWTGRETIALNQIELLGLAERCSSFLRQNG